MVISRQFPLNITLDDGASFDSFCGNSSRQLLAALKESSEGAGEQFIFIWGNRGSGKSHLLQSACRLAGELEGTAAYIPFDLAPKLAPDLLTGLEEMNLVCLDDIQQVVGNAGWEQALFNLFNRIRERSGRLLVSADCSPLALPIELPDLTSRLSWGVSYRLVEPNDAEKIDALVDSAKRRGMDLTTDTANYILKQHPRDMGSLLTFLNELDRASLAAQRRPTTQFVRTLLKTL